MDSKVKIKVLDMELTVSDARSIYDELHALFGKPKIELPVSPCDPVYPATPHPWDQYKKSYPWITETITCCDPRLNNG